MMARASVAAMIAMALLAAPVAAPVAAVAADACHESSAPVKLSPAQAARVLPKQRGYTQGLLHAGASLYESLGVYGRSALRKIDLRTNTHTDLHALPREIFAEGLAALDGRLYQLSWQENLVFTYADDKPGRTIAYPFRGWGLTHLDGRLVASDGTSKLRFLEPSTLAVTREVEVARAGARLSSLNELETVKGAILANIYGEDWIASIDPQTGCARAALDVRELRETATRAGGGPPVCPGSACDRKWDFVANGIAYDGAADELYLTGKNWPMIFVFRNPGGS